MEEVVFASRSMVYCLFKWAKPGLHSFLVRCVRHAPQVTVGAAEAFSSAVLGSILRRCTALSPVSLSFERHNFVDRSGRSALIISSFVVTATS
jgi:hypothetical protein